MLIRSVGVSSGMFGSMSVGRAGRRGAGLVGRRGICFNNGGGGKPVTFNPIDLIGKTRDRQELTAAEMKFMIDGVISGAVTPLQAGAWLVATKINSLNDAEVDFLAFNDEFQAAVSQLTPKGVGREYDEILEKTSQKIPLTRQEIFTFIEGVVSGKAADAQIGGWLMAVRLNGLTDDEVAYLSEAMWKTGGEINLSKVPGKKGDKHAAGGSCDITSFLIAPLLACFGMKVPMMSGRMLAHTGGTLDKLESIPGFNVDLDEATIVANLKDGPGLAIFGQMNTIAPADKKLYAMRQLTGTVQSIPLIAASIISKKLAERADCLALVGTFGSGAFARDPDEARGLSTLMMNAAKKVGRKVVSFLVDMSQPLAPYVGPALEMKLAIRALKGQPDKRLDRLYEVSIAIAAQLLVMGEVYRPEQLEEAKVALREKLHNGEALEKFRQMVVAQGGDPSVVGDLASFEDSSLMVQGQHRIEVRAQRAGYIQAIRADEIGNAINDLGAGRTEQRPKISHRVGAAELALVGDKVVKDDVIAVIYADDQASGEVAKARILGAYTIGNDYVAPPPVIYEIVT